MCPQATKPLVHKIWCMWVFPKVLLVQPLNRLFSNQPHHTCARPCRRPSKSQNNGARARGCGKCPQATRPHVHKIWCMCVFPNVLVVQPLHGFVSKKPHHTCARPFRSPSKSRKVGAKARGCGKCPQATRPHVHKIW
jgi:hypothetical protein